MHYFIDYTKLTAQTNGDKFGPVESDPDSYNVTSAFNLQAEAKAFACQAGSLIVQSCASDPTLVNVILKPLSGLKVPLNGEVYYVYRGLKKSNLVNGVQVVAKSAESNNELISRIYNSFLPLSETYPADLLGFSDSIDPLTKLEDIFNSQHPVVKPVSVLEGEWIGDFKIGKIGFEVIIESERLNMNLAFLRKNETKITTTSLSGLTLKVKKEEVLSFIDPAAFFGMHYKNGVGVSSYDSGSKKVSTKKENDLYGLLLSQFATRNNVYLDIRSETGYSYNFYGNYAGSGGDNIKIGSAGNTSLERSYSTGIWPIVILKELLTTADKLNNIKFNLRIDDNLKPLLFFQDPQLIKKGSASAKKQPVRTIGHQSLLNQGDANWTNDIVFYFPNAGTGPLKSNVANYIKSYYFREEISSSSPVSVLKKNFFLDNVFGFPESQDEGLINAARSKSNTVSDAINVGRVFQNDQFDFISGEHPVVESAYYGDPREILSEVSEYAHLSLGGGYADDNRVVFYAKLNYPVKQSRSLYSVLSQEEGGVGLRMSGKLFSKSFLATDLVFTFLKIEEELSPGAYGLVDVLDINAVLEQSMKVEELFVLGLTQNELTLLKNVSGLSSIHKKYIVFEDVSTPSGLDTAGFRYRKYKLKVQGLDDSGQQKIVLPINDVYVYCTGNQVYTSKDFASEEVSKLPDNYQANYEESMGAVEVEAGRTRFKFFINKDSGLEVIVSHFIEELKKITAVTPNAYKKIEALVRNDAKAIFTRSTSFVKNNVNTPDDRPLYWARLSMELELKRHVFFKGQYSKKINGQFAVKKGSNLFSILTLFEERSRNYTNIVFPARPDNNRVNVLVTGFDPFQLNNNWKQSNPSGACALSLNGEVIGNAYIQTMIFPVRYTDFDGSDDPYKGSGRGVVENYIGRLIKEVKAVDMVITISQSLKGQFHIDRFGTNLRLGFEDNSDHTRIENQNAVLLLPVDEKSKTWIETTLPKAMAMGGGTDQKPDAFDHFTCYAQSYQIGAETKYDDYDLTWDPEKHYYKSSKPGAVYTIIKKENNDLFYDDPLSVFKQKKKIEAGSGGNYLSNEIFYRVALLRENWLKLNKTKTFPTGHFHVSMVQFTEANKGVIDLSELYENSNRTIYKELALLISTVKERIRLGTVPDANGQLILFENAPLPPKI